MATFSPTQAPTLAPTVADMSVAEAQTIGALIEIVATTMTVCGLNAAKWSLMYAELPDNDLHPDKWWLNWRWILAMCFYAFGQVLDASAHSFGSQDLLVTITVISLGTNAYVAHKIFDEPFNTFPPNWGKTNSLFMIIWAWDAFAVCLTFVGVAIGAAFAPPPPDWTVHAAYAPKFDEYFCCSGLTFIWLAWLLFLVSTSIYCVVRIATLPEQKDSTSKLGGILFGFLTAFTGAVTVTFSEPATHMLKDLGSGHNQFAMYPSATLYVLALLFFAVSTIVALNIGLKNYEATVVYPIYNVVNTIAADICGLLYYRTYENESPGKLVVFFVGLMLALTGVVLLLVHRERDAEQEKERFNAKRQKFEDYVGQRGIDRAKDRIGSTLRTSKRAFSHLLSDQPARSYSFGGLESARSSEIDDSSSSSRTGSNVGGLVNRMASFLVPAKGGRGNSSLDPIRSDNDSDLTFGTSYEMSDMGKGKKKSKNELAQPLLHGSSDPSGHQALGAAGGNTSEADHAVVRMYDSAPAGSVQATLANGRKKQEQEQKQKQEQEQEHQQRSQRSRSDFDSGPGSGQLGDEQKHRQDYEQRVSQFIARDTTYERFGTLSKNRAKEEKARKEALEKKLSDQKDGESLYQSEGLSIRSTSKSKGWKGVPNKLGAVSKFKKAAADKDGDGV